MTTPRAYYNEWDPYAAAWLRNLIAAGHIAPGDVDERSILDVCPADLAGYTQCHFFAGIGGWSLALRLAGWPDDRAVWTGSCPCQPFSAAGKGLGFADERHLWPAWEWIIRQLRPPRLYGEQVVRAIHHGWLDLAALDLETLAYAVAAALVPAAAVGADHLRERAWFVADAVRDDVRVEPGGTGGARGVGAPLAALPGEAGPPADAGGPGLPLPQHPELRRTWGRTEGGAAPQHDWRAPEPGVVPVVHGVPGRVGRIRALGNAIIPEVAARFILASDAAAREARR